MDSATFPIAVARVVERGLAAAAILDRDGKLIAVSGQLSESEIPPIAGIVTTLEAEQDLARRMFAGEIVEFSLDEREVGVGIAGRCVFVVVVLGRSIELSRELAKALQHDTDRVIRAMQAEIPGSPPWGRGSGGSSSGPAELPVIEIGLTVQRDRGKA